MGETSSKMTGKTMPVKVKKKTKGAVKAKKQSKRNQFAKASTSKSKYQERIDALTHYDLTSYNDDIDVMASIFNIRKSKRDWITTARWELQERANKYEHLFGNFLLKHNVHFIHQAPFVIDGHIYFADFYLPEKHIVVEIDGIYHSGNYQQVRDRNRTDDLEFAGTKVVRIKNVTTMDENMLLAKCKINGIL